MHKLAEEKIYKGNGCIPGVSKYGKDWHFTYMGKCRSLCLYLYTKSKELYFQIDMKKYKIAGEVYSLIIRDMPKEVAFYAIFVDDVQVEDPFFRRPVKARGWLEKAEEHIYPVCNEDFNWENDTCPKHALNDVITYLLHVRGFTIHSSSKVRHKGTFLGVAEKVEHFKKLGINQIELMPAYDFYEKDIILESKSFLVDESAEKEERINYWGFKAGNYFCPNQTYSCKDPVNEFKKMVKTLHENGIEVIMQFYFPGNFNSSLIEQILHYWVCEYHVDGFKLLGESLPVQSLSCDMLLMDTKLYFVTDSIYQVQHMSGINENIVLLARDYSDTLRRFLKGDEDTLHSFVDGFKANPSRIKRANYITNYEGFTLLDLVSYDYKHNEMNGEENRDGTNNNYSWNCGYEGTTKKKTVINLRIKQVKNALCMLLLGQAAPVLLAGDEMLNTQQGNNNAYCQDNEVTWLNWSMNSKKQEIMDYTSALIRLRKEYNIFHMDKELKMMDGLSCGYPDMSLHGSEAWYPKLESYLRHIGIMLCEKYANPASDDIIYLAYNMYWEENTFALPKPAKGKKWKVIMTTEENERKPDEILKDRINVVGRSVVILKAE